MISLSIVQTDREGHKSTSKRSSNWYKDNPLSGPFLGIVGEKWSWKLKVYYVIIS